MCLHSQLCACAHEISKMSINSQLCNDDETALMSSLLHEFDPLSAEWDVLNDLILLKSSRLQNGKTFRNYESRFLATFNTNGSSMRLFKSVYGLLLLSLAALYEKKRVSVLSSWTSANDKDKDGCSKVSIVIYSNAAFNSSDAYT